MGCYGTYSIDQVETRVMTMDDFTVVSCTDTCLTALGAMLSYNKEWPAEIVHKGRTYLFSGIEPMPAYAVGNYHGCAKYECHSH